jgi:hypothetical protein
MIDPLARYILPQDGEERARAAENLIHAGFRSEKALPYFYGLKSALALGLPLLVFIASGFIPQWTMSKLAFALLIAAFIGVILPNIVLDKIKENRLKKLRNGFPDALDLLVVCVEAGLGLGAAIDRVARDLEVSHLELAEELSLVNVEIRAGVERPVALKNLAGRTGLPDIQKPGRPHWLARYPRIGRAACTDNAIRHQHRRGAARLFRRIQGQAYAKSRRAGGQDWNQTDFSTRYLFVSGVLHRGHRPCRTENNLCFRQAVESIARSYEPALRYLP